LKFNQLDVSGPRVVESLREVSRFDEPPIDRVPTDVFEPSDSRAAHAFDGQVRYPIEGASRTPDPIVGRIDPSRERPSAAKATITSPSTMPHREPSVANHFRFTLGPAAPAGVLWTTLAHDCSAPEIDTR
jgi:hypothetical protein